MLRAGRVLFLGGDTVTDKADPNVGTPDPSTAELFDPRTGAFSSAGGLKVERWAVNAVLLADGRVLIAGGIQDDAPVAGAELYDPATGSFRITGSMRVAKFLTSLVALQDGRVFAIGGNEGSSGSFVQSAELFDPATGAFTAIGSAGDLDVPSRERRWPPRAWGPAVLLRDGRVLLAGLRCQEVQSLVNGYGEGFEPMPNMLFDPPTERFLQGPVLPHCIEHAIALPDGRVFLTSFWSEGHEIGTFGSDAIEVDWSALYDSETGDIRPTAQPAGGRYLQVVPLPDGRLLALGHRLADPNDPSSAHQVAEIFQ